MGWRQQKKGVVVAYPDKAYADHEALTLLNQLRQHLPSSEYRDALPAQIVKCCTEIRNQTSSAEAARFEMLGTFDIGQQSIRFRAVSLPPKRPGDTMPILVLLDLMSE